MTYRSILALVSLTGEAKDAAIGPIALDLAARWKAHLTMFIPVPHRAMPIYAAAPGGAAIILEEDSEGLNQARQIADRIQRAANANGVTVKIVIENKDYDGVLKSLAAAARLCDLSLLRTSTVIVQDGVEALLFGSGRPVLIVPHEASSPLMLSNAMIAWDGGLESARAVHAALPILEKAKAVEIVTITGEKDLIAHANGAELARMLARRDISVTATDLPMAETAAKRLLDHATLKHCDLIVAGAYGHSRWRQFLFGGVTTTLLTDAKVPVLMAH
jgi:nucleotide-binding universal stress UspA family protein